MPDVDRQKHGLGDAGGVRNVILPVGSLSSLVDDGE